MGDAEEEKQWLDPSLDPTSSRHEPPPLPPLDRAALTPTFLAGAATALAKPLTESHLQRWFWGEGVALYGMVAAARATGSAVPAVVSDYFDRFDTDVACAHVNNLMPGAVAALLGRDRLVARLLDWLDSPGALSVNQAGAFEHWPGAVWADTVFMAGTFLAEAARTTGRTELAERAVRQWLVHSDVLQDPTTGLWAHGSHRGETLWWFWARGCAWAALSGVGLLDFDVRGSDELRRRVVRLLDGVTAYQRSNGAWEVLLDGHPETQGIVESSGTAGLAAALIRARELSPTYLNAGTRGLAAALAYLGDDGVLGRVSAGTVLQLVPFGYSVIRTDRMQLWGQGLALLACAEGIRAGSA